MKRKCNTGSSGDVLKLVFNSLPVGVIVYGPDGHVIDINPAAEELTGYTKEELVGSEGKNRGVSLFETISGDEPDFTCSQSRGGGRDAILTNKFGKRIDILCFESELRDDRGNVCGTVRMFRDISEEKRVRKKHRILISMFAHDLKAPVAIAGGFINRLLLGKGGKLTDKQLEYLKIVERELKKLDSHIHSFLDILRMEAGDIQLSLEKCSIEQLIYDVVEEFQERATSKKITLSVKVPEENLIIAVDREQLQRVFVNLIDNAIKYSDENSSVEVMVEDHDNYIVCRVKDSGPGIDEADLPYIFDPFFRSKNASDDGVDGTGIGLAVVKSIVEAHNGNVWVESGENGTVFSFSIPKNLTQHR